ncbi:MAG: hypothetical protein ACLQF1_15115 [Methyloceanibacter sp.]
MGTEDRLKEILARQVAAAEANRQREEEAQVAAQKAKELRAEVTQKWRVQRAYIERFVVQLNEQIRKNDVQLSVRDSRYPAPEGTFEVDKIEIGFQPRSRGDMRNLTIAVRPNGEIYVSIASSTTSPAKHYTLNTLKATNDELEGTVLDFLDVNTPR